MRSPLTASDGRGWLRLVIPRDNTSAPFTAEHIYAALHARTAPAPATPHVLPRCPAHRRTRLLRQPPRPDRAGPRARHGP